MALAPIQKKGIVVQAWYPLGGRGYTRELLENETLVAIGKKHNVSAAQVILRWDLQNGVVVVPGSSNPKQKVSYISMTKYPSGIEYSL